MTLSFFAKKTLILLFFARLQLFETFIDTVLFRRFRFPPLSAFAVRVKPLQRIKKTLQIRDQIFVERSYVLNKMIALNIFIYTCLNTAWNYFKEDPTDVVNKCFFFNGGWYVWVTQKKPSTFWRMKRLFSQLIQNPVVASYCFSASIFGSNKVSAPHIYFLMMVVIKAFEDLCDWKAIVMGRHRKTFKVLTPSQLQQQQHKC